MKLLEVKNVSKVYGTRENAVKALQNVSFSMQKGEFAAVVGESGSGKSTLLNCIGGLDTPTSGSILLEGTDLFALKEERRTVFRRRSIGFIFQSFHLIEELDVEQNMIFPLLLDRRKPDQKRVEELLDILGLADRRHHLPCQISGGQKQRTAIGRALMTRPILVLADEPTGNLDSQNSREVMELLLRASRHYRQTVLMITHNMQLCASADRVLKVRDGKLQDLGGAAS